ncbi:MAG: hypothetical protein ACD_2C00075G0002 [uncultured bacterium (gcode 4)]|uniref:Fibrobacter succinogenes major paralogous domain-containing protein n=1 Tax=uncultured bacterium (gcode 4) TaxID=1234023 RepID=K2H240_9BACT|nr:MAG: hypothetical protein ACD_2C00075G0002 [uncultured bacterium (gcode 4)]
MQKMQAAYSWSNINTPIIQNTLSSSWNELIQIWIMLVKHTLWWNISSTINTSQLSQWRDIPWSNCTNDDYVFTTGSITYRWSWCNSVFWTWFEWWYKDNWSLGTVSLCYSYNSVSTPANCPIWDLSMSGNSKEKDWTIASWVSWTVNNIWWKFYTWSQASQADNACPTGWHLPSDQEWSILESALSPNCLDVNAENQWRCVSDWLGWLNNNLKTTSNNIVQALKIPLWGYRDANGSTFYDRGGSTSLWSSSASGSNAYRRYLNYNNIGVSRSTKDKLTWYPVRCLKN